MRRRDALLVGLAFTAGCVDALSYLGLGKVFTANMTGNTVLLGIALGQRSAMAALRSACALGGFLVGAGLAAVLTRGPGDHGPWSRAVTLALAAELAILTALAAAWNAAGTGGGRVYWLIALGAAGMGTQSAAVTRLGISGVTTTYLTGTLTRSVMRLVDGIAPRRRRDADQRPLVLPIAVWAVYLAAAVASGAAFEAWAARTAWIFVGVLALIVAASVPLAFGRREPRVDR